MDEELKIYVDQLRGGKVEKIDRSFSSDFLDVHEDMLSFHDNVVVGGEAYVTNEDLVLHLDLATKGLISCSICNDPVDVDLKIQGYYFVEPLSNIKSGIYNMRDLIREVVLLEIPEFAECNEGNCPKRKEIGKYLKKPSSQQGGEDEHGFNPFTDLTLEEENKE